MNFLQIVQRLAREAGVTAPSAVTNQTGEARRLVDWANSAWVDIQNAHNNWLWMRKECTVTTTAGDGSYAPSDFTDVSSGAAISAFSYWHTGPGNLWTIYKQSSGQSDESDLWFIPYDHWRYLYDRGANVSTQSRPIHFSIAPDNAFKLGYKPDAAYVVRGWYQKSATDLTQDNDTPDMPSQYHMAIVWRALMYYGSYESASESYGRGEAGYRSIMGELAINQLPAVCVGPPLV